MLKVFGLGSSKKYAAKVCEYLGIECSSHVENCFDDGETYIKSTENVRDADVYVISSLHSDSKSLDKSQTVSEKLINLLWFIGSLKDASAKRITVVTPYLGFARQDRKTESRAPITTKYMAQVLEAVGANRVLTTDVHSLAAFQNSFRIPVDNLDATRLFVDHLTGVPSFPAAVKDWYHLRNKDVLDLDLAIVSPDNGGLNRCGLFQKALANRIGEIKQTAPQEIPLAIFDKRRVNGKVEGSRIIGDVKGKQCIILDDLIASGSTIIRAAEAVDKAGGEVYAVCATHGQFTDSRAIIKMMGHQIGSAWIDTSDAHKALVKNLIVTDSINQTDNFYGSLTLIDTARFIGEAIKRTHAGGSISDLLEC